MRKVESFVDVGLFQDTTRRLTTIIESGQEEVRLLLTREYSPKLGELRGRIPNWLYHLYKQPNRN